jgi:hypothetical protein
VDIGKFMFSVLGNIFPVQPRQAENADTRLDIKRHDPDQERRKKEGKEDDKQHFDTADNATVSIEALHSFLVNFLKSQEEETKTPENKNLFAEEISPPSETTPPPPPVASQNAKAASAYQTTAQKTSGRSFSSENTDAIAQALHLGAAEIRTIHILLEDLKSLSTRNIEYITIERSTTFLQSLVDGVARAKNS